MIAFHFSASAGHFDADAAFRPLWLPLRAFLFCRCRLLLLLRYADVFAACYVYYIATC